MNVCKPHPNLSIRTTVSVNLSADQWALKTQQHPRVIIEKVADYLNKRVNSEFNRGESRPHVEKAVESLADDFKIYGASDPSSKEVLNGLLDELYKH